MGIAMNILGHPVMPLISFLDRPPKSREILMSFWRQTNIKISRDLGVLFKNDIKGITGCPRMFIGMLIGCSYDAHRMLLLNLR